MEKRQEKKSLGGLVNLFFKVQSPQGAQSPQRFSEHIENGNSPKDIKIPKLSEEEYIETYFTMSYKWPESEGWPDCLTRKALRT